MKNFLDNFLSQHDVFYRTIKNKIEKDIDIYTNELVLKEKHMKESYPRTRNNYSLDEKKRYGAKVFLNHKKVVEQKMEHQRELEESQYERKDTRTRTSDIGRDSKLKSSMQLLDGVTSINPKSSLFQPTKASFSKVKNKKANLNFKFGIEEE
eukprot:CAMPEP_0170534898 /NCGR_PEP_ID=MMETSP0209-20121228/95999_1 /TAXON_ID=665100 ORGANISM="Litonotus pictus, Strain P1" /NCGR_SAMPLE_ID=MMETSP0209 /ASSEMBLY_ACC=CAM_ASM_000301 /LENGTH=151 /DNA_ID=CAMNT_0010835093 /DNA_START=39 /DNA_END=491 /DNA_ORIENTATION=+